MIRRVQAVTGWLYLKVWMPRWAARKLGDLLDHWPGFNSTLEAVYTRSVHREYARLWDVPVAEVDRVMGEIAAMICGEEESDATE